MFPLENPSGRLDLARAGQLVRKTLSSAIKAGILSFAGACVYPRNASAYTFRTPSLSGQHWHISPGLPVFFACPESIFRGARRLCKQTVNTPSTTSSRARNLSGGFASDVQEKVLTCSKRS
jgi:hypothetical protein